VPSWRSSFAACARGTDDVASDVHMYRPRWLYPTRCYTCVLLSRSSNNHLLVLVVNPITRLECAGLYNFLSDHVAIPKGCQTLVNPDDKVNMAEPHRNSWLWPTLARRATHGNMYHVNKWEPPVTTDDAGCATLLEALRKLGKNGGGVLLPDECKHVAIFD